MKGRTGSLLVALISLCPLSCRTDLEASYKLKLSGTYLAARHQETPCITGVMDYRLVRRGHMLLPEPGRWISAQLVRKWYLICKVWGHHGSDYEECRLLGYENPVLTSQKTNYVSATEPSQLMPYIIWGFHGGDCEECRLLGYKNPVLTSQKTNYVSATEPSQLMLYMIWGFHGGDCEECRLLGYKPPVHTS
jgi:hypothetical protein